MSLLNAIFKKFKKNNKINWDDLEETLVKSDLGIHLSMQIIDELKHHSPKLTEETLSKACFEKILSILSNSKLNLFNRELNSNPTVILITGINGVGKTTSIAKLANWIKQKNNSVMIAAADTFRAAAIDQIQMWGEKIDVEVISGKYQDDPSSVCFKAHDKAIKEKVDYLICDTAGRLHTKNNLMEELKKINRTLSKQDSKSPHHRWLVVDSSNGSNSLSQAHEFKSFIDINGLIVTKLDGSGKGGSVISIKHKLNIPTHFIGTGEKINDFKEFEPKDFVSDIL